jgi:Asp-tRNA(Asn)/Glu-tRNA(Gln) amidotransferase B subunit
VTRVRFCHGNKIVIHLKLFQKIAATSNKFRKSNLSQKNINEILKFLEKKTLSNKNIK